MVYPRPICILLEARPLRIVSLKNIYHDMQKCLWHLVVANNTPYSAGHTLSAWDQQNRCFLPLLSGADLIPWHSFFKRESCAPSKKVCSNYHYYILLLLLTTITHKRMTNTISLGHFPSKKQDLLIDFVLYVLYYYFLYYY